MKAAIPRHWAWNEVAIEKLSVIPGIGEKTVEVLREAGLSDVGAVYDFSCSRWMPLTHIEGIGEKTAKNLWRDIETYIPEDN